MPQRITRRRFGQLAIATTTVAGLGYLANRTVAQTASVDVLGLRPTPSNTASTDRVALRSTNVANATSAPQTLSNQVTSNLAAGERLSGFTTLRDGTLIVAISPVRGSQRQDDPTRLTFERGPTSRSPLTLSGLNTRQTIDSLLATNDGRLLALVMRKNGRPPVQLAEINLQTGQLSISNQIVFPSDQRFTQLAQCPDGRFYTTLVESGGRTSLVQLDFTQQKPVTLAQLTINGNVWNSGLTSLICSSAGQLLGLGSRRYETFNQIYTINPSNGVMTQLKQYDVAKITAPAPQ